MLEFYTDYYNENIQPCLKLAHKSICGPYSSYYEPIAVKLSKDKEGYFKVYHTDSLPFYSDFRGLYNLPNDGDFFFKLTAFDKECDSFDMYLEGKLSITSSKRVEVLPGLVLQEVYFKIL